MPRVLGDEIREARLAARLTQEQLAFSARVSRNYISLLELGAKSPTVATLMRIASALGVRASGLLARAEERESKKQVRRR